MIEKNLKKSYWIFLMIIEKFDFPTPIFISEVKEHSLIKETVLDMIEKVPCSGALDNKNDKLVTDFFIKDEEKTYFKYIGPILSKYLNNHIEEMGYINNCNIKFCIAKYWFQQYHENGCHNWHFHDTCWSNVYYLELPDDSPGTEFMVPCRERQTYFPPIKEGTLITFPSSILHRSPPNQSKKRKTIISFNAQGLT